jgi:predicted dehydrogenase
LLKVAIVGCGRIADQHAQHILRTPGARIVAACDRELMMAQQLKERFQIDRAYDDAKLMLLAERPDVVHITTPPDSHRLLAELCMKSGSHVYIEKPFALDGKQTDEIIAIAESTGRKLTVGHNVQFTWPAIELRRLIREGYLGGSPQHMESHYGYDLGSIKSNPIVADKNHWVRVLPGQIFHNIVSHGIAKFVEFWPGERVDVTARAFFSTAMREAGDFAIPDELRVMLVNPERSVSAYFSFFTQFRPLLHQFRVYGPENGLQTDDDHLTLVKLRGKKYKSYLDHVVPSLNEAKQYAACAFRNVMDFLRRRQYNDSGMGNLIGAFYSSILNCESAPIPYREIALTAHIMDEIFLQVSAQSASTRC